ncbi:hypothetical protein B0A49_11325, partial [Cryomyces minteri]
GLVEDKMPEVTKFAFLLERQINILLESVRATAMQGNEGAEDDSVQQEFVVEQMLHVALTLDYSDEVGRRKMFSLMREVLALADLPEESTKLVIEGLRTVCGGNAAGEREFCGIVLEAVAEVHDIIMGDDNTEQGDESFHSARSEISSESTPKKAQVMKKSKRTDEEEMEDSAMEDEKAVREIMVNMKCLHIAQCMLQNVQCDLEGNVHLVTMLNNLVVPAVRSQEAPIRERGLLCLGLCCLLGKNLAEENLTLFLHCFAKGHPALQTISIQIICDILTTHPTLLSPPPMPTNADQTEVEANPLQKPVHKMFAKALKSPEGDVQLAGCTALCKLMLTNIIRDTDLLKQLVVAYFEPDTQGNAGLRQALSYFLPVYCHSRTENAERMVAVAVSVVHSLVNMSEELDEEEEMVGMGVVAAHLVDWTDPRRVIGAAGALGTVTGKEKEAGGEVHFSLAEELLEKILTPGTSKEEKKIFISMLGKLYISPECAPAKLRAIFDLVNEVLENKIITDATSRNVLTRLQASLSKCITETRAQEESEKEAGDTVAATAELNNDDDVTAQPQTELDADETRVEEPDAEGTVVGDDDAPTEAGDGEIDMDMTGLAPDSAIQDLLDSFGDEDDPDLIADADTPPTSTHPLLAQVPLTVSPFITLPTAPTLPYTYKSLPSTLPPSSLTGTSNSTNPLDSSQPRQNQYVLSSTGHASNPMDIIASCRALQAHLDRTQQDAEKLLREWEEGIKERDLAERRRVAPGWLDREEKILQPERRSTPGQQQQQQDAQGQGDGAPANLMDDEVVGAGNAQDAGVSQMGAKSATDEGAELDRAFGGMSVR